MFDFRYHVVSLAAVFVALIIGILVGIGISGRGFVDKTERQNLQQDIENARNEADALATKLRESEARQDAAQEFVQKSYPLLMADRLRGKSIAVLFVGPVDDAIGDELEETLDSADANPTLRLRALKLPIDPVVIDRTLASRPVLRPFVGDDRLDELGRKLGQEFAAGGETPAWNALSDTIVEERSGRETLPADGVVVVRSIAPQGGPTARFLAGLYRGLGSADVPVVGVETTTAKPSAIGVFTNANLSTVDDLNAPEGRLALAILLEGTQTGHFGLKDTAAAVLPRVEPVTVTTGG